jgi:hypothetical protein
MLPRRWGREELSDWCLGVPRPPAPVGEIWSSHGANPANDAQPLDAMVRDDPSRMLGDLGRAPPSVRLILTGEPTDPIEHDGRLALWRVLESPIDAALTAATPNGRIRRIRGRRGDIVRVDDQVSLCFDAGVAAIEVRPSFNPDNGAPRANPVRRVLASRERSERQTWLRDAALSVELWTLPESSTIHPDGETCHVLTALTPGVCIDGRTLARGQSVFVPAQASAAVLTGRGAQLMVSYPDLVPTNIWRHTPHPDPVHMAMSQAALLSINAEHKHSSPTFQLAA